MKNSNQNRRQFLRKTSMAGLAGLTWPLVGHAFSQDYPGEIPVSPDEAFSLPMLGYAYEALEPNVDKMTMEIHHSRHHQAYVTNLNKAMKENNLDASLDV